jgi:hypothetical protein
MHIFNVFRVLAIKQIAAGNTGAASSKPKSTGNGKFTFWADSTADQVDGYIADPSAASSNTCLDSCTIDSSCYAVLIKNSRPNDEFMGCGLIKPIFQQGNDSVRTLMRAVPERTFP